MSLIPKGEPIRINQCKISGVKGDFPNKEVTITIKVPFAANPDILAVAEDQLAFISFSDMPVEIEIQQLQMVMDLRPVTEVKLSRRK